MISADPSANPVLSLAGGQPGLGGNFLDLGSDAVGKVLEAGGLPGSRAEVEEQAGPPRLHPKAQLPLPKGDCVVVEFNGSAGYGDPLGRDPERVAGTSPTARSAASRPSATTAWSSTATPSTTPAPRRGGRRSRGAARRRGRVRRRRAPATIDRGAVLVPGAAGGVDVAEHAGERVWACSACGEHLGPMGETFSSAPATGSVRRRPSTTGCTPIRRSSPRRSSCCASTRARAAPLCSPRSSASPITAVNDSPLALGRARR